MASWLRGWATSQYTESQNCSSISRMRALMSSLLARAGGGGGAWRRRPRGEGGGDGDAGDGGGGGESILPMGRC